MSTETNHERLSRLRRHRDYAERQAQAADERGDETSSRIWTLNAFNFDKLINATLATTQGDVAPTHTEETHA